MKMATGSELLTQELVRCLFEYREGELYTRNRLSLEDNGVKIGWEHFGGKAGKYKHMSIFGKVFKIHRVIFLYHHGFLPEMIDHINGDSFDNRIENLRETDPAENARNKKKREYTRSGVKGVNRHNPSGRWSARITRPDGKREYLGLFKTVEEASAVYKKRSIELYGEWRE